MPRATPNLKVYTMCNLDTLTPAALDRLIDDAIDAMEPDDSFALYLPMSTHRVIKSYAVTFEKELNQ